MHRILAVAVGQGADTSAAAVARMVIGTRHSKEMRPYVAGLISGLEKLGLRAGSDFEIDYATAEPAKLKKLVQAAIAEHKPDAIFAMRSFTPAAAHTQMNGLTIPRKFSRDAC